MIRRLTEAEREMWDRVRRSVRPLRRTAGPARNGDPVLAPAEAESGASADKARPGPRHRKPAANSPPAAQAKPAPRPAAIEPRLKRRLARGTAAIDGRLDLHGLDQQAAILALERFLRARQAEGDRMVLVITGKGRAESATSGILKRQVPHWLSLPRFRDLVVGYDEAARRHGGGGALYIRLRRPAGRA